ncbi:hypothetical protein ACN47E_009440 [Coniothyrium glycines]
MSVHRAKAYTLPGDLRYYILRGNAMVSLVPVDQLPFQLQGFPRQLSHRQLSDEGWKFVAETTELASQIPVQSPSTTFANHTTASGQPRHLAPDHHVRSEATTGRLEGLQSSRYNAASPATSTVPDVVRLSSASITERPLSLTDSFAAIYQQDAQRIGYRTSHPSGIEPDQTKKEYCTHWIKTGECAFMSIGCKYKHEMPDVEKLRELGFTQGMPRWWKEKSAIVARGPTWMQRRSAEENCDNEDSINPSPRRDISDISTWRHRTQTKKSGEDDKDQPRQILKKDTSSHNEATSHTINLPRLTSPRVIRTHNSIEDLLIDLGDTPAPPSSPRTSIASCDRSTLISNCTTASSNLCSDVSSAVPTHINAHSATSSSTKNTAKTQYPSTRPQSRRRSTTSWASESEEETKPVKLATSAPKRKSPPRRTSKPSTASTLPVGLASSKYASSTVREKALTNHNKNTSHRKRESKDQDVDGPALLGQIEQLKREMYTKVQKAKTVQAEARKVLPAGTRIVVAKDTAV